MQHCSSIHAVLLALLLASAHLSSAQIRLPNPPKIQANVPRLPTATKLPGTETLSNLFRRRRVAAGQARPGAAGDAAPAAEVTKQAPAPAPAAPAARPAAPVKCSGDWARTAVGAAGASSSSSSSSSSKAGSSLPAYTERVLICLISSGVHKDAANLKQNRWTGCTREDPLDPTGCTLPWFSSPSLPSFKPRGTWLASIIAGSEGGVISGSTDFHVVPVDGPGGGAVDPTSSAPSGKSRLRAYSVCEGRLRGLQAMDYGVSSKQPWRMIMMVDVAADKPAVSGPGDFAVTEAEWVRLATGRGTPEAVHSPDVLIIAPAGHDTAVGFPAAVPGVLGVGALKCNGEPILSYGEQKSDGNTGSGSSDGAAAAAASVGSSSKPEILAPGMNVAIPGEEKPWTDSTAAAALVTGAAARLWTAYPRCSADEIKAALLTTSEVKGQPARLNLQAAATALELASCGGQQLTR